MTHEEMLARLGVTKEELGDLLTKFSNLHKSLTPAQQALVEASLPNLHDAAASFGPAVEAPELRALFEKQTSGASFLAAINQPHERS